MDPSIKKLPKYKVGTTVIIKPIQWNNGRLMYKSLYGQFRCGSKQRDNYVNIPTKVKFITSYNDIFLYHLEGNNYSWEEWMLKASLDEKLKLLG